MFTAVIFTTAETDEQTKRTHNETLLSLTKEMLPFATIWRTLG